MRIVKNRAKKLSIILGWTICGLGAIFYCYEYLLRIEPSVMTPQLMHRFMVTAEGLGFLSALYYYAYTPMQLVVGILIDRYGTRIILTAAIVVCTAGNLLFSNAHLIYFAGMGRFLIGLGSAFAFVGVLKLAAEWLPKHHFAFFAGFATSLGMMGAMVGDVGLTVLIHKIGWKHTLHFATLFGVILIPFIWLVVRDTPKRSRDKTSRQLLTYREAWAGLLKIIKNPYMWMAGAIGCTLFLSLSVVAEMWGIPFLEATYGLSADKAAFACSLIFAGWLVGAPINGWLSDRAGTRRFPVIVGSFFSAITFGVVVYHPLFLTSGLLDVFLFLFGAFASVEVVCFAIGRESNPTNIAATAVAFTNLLIMFGGIVMQPLIGKLLELGWDGIARHGIHVYSSANFHRIFWLVPVIMLFGTMIALLLPGKFSHDHYDEFD